MTVVFAGIIVGIVLTFVLLVWGTGVIILLSLLAAPFSFLAKIFTKSLDR